MTEQPAVDTTDSLVVERTLDAPIDVVWSMWTDARHFAAWYGPDGADIPHLDFEVRGGGTRRLCMRVPTPQGPTEMWFTGEFLTVDPPHRLVYSEAIADAEGNVKSAVELGMPESHPTVTEVRVELQTVDSGTHMVMTHVGVPPDSPGAAGWTTAVDALEHHLARN
ncbi:MAG TPA: SRPBCC domain-containing protein [Ornithinimicrobium sp.]|uniref:SRPBCC family protein n=1 Tax=Ornithinimicrobium sp. TaxID=1977084 RepID=UPI002B4A0E1D|nr:SRPBCC domain-containing protein [Ornithinimicrobium sp.]HKJ12857.1 SRPBCC domain-containing protein [Ornithinimicrobium sp.]